MSTPNLDDAIDLDLFNPEHALLLTFLLQAHESALIELMAFAATYGADALDNGTWAPAITN